MKSLRIHQRLLIFLTASLAVACLISPWMSLGADWTAAQWPELLSERVPFSKIFNRAFMIAGIMLFIFFRRILVPPEIKHLLTPGAHIAWRNFLTGWGLALVSMVLLGAVMAAADVFAPYFRLSRGEMLGRLAGALFAGVFVGFLEELFFRGILFFGLREHGHALRAYFLANLFYSVLHFVKPGESYFLEGLDVFAGFRHLLTTFDPFLRPLELLPGIIGLFLIGVVFSYALARTGNLYLSIGLHAGWIFSLEIVSRLRQLQSPGFGLGLRLHRSEDRQRRCHLDRHFAGRHGNQPPHPAARQSQAVSLPQERRDLFGDPLRDQAISRAVWMNRIASQCGVGKNPFHHSRYVKRAELLSSFFKDGRVLIGEKTKPHAGDHHHRPVSLHLPDNFLEIFARVLQRHSPEKIIAA